MTKEETLKVCFIIQSTYPQHYDKFGDRERRAMQEAWSAILEDYDYHTVCAGLKAYIANDTKGFPPVPGQIIDQIQKLMEKPEEKMTDAEAWHMVYRALCNSLYHADEEYNKLPPVVQRAVGSPNVLKQWAQDENVSVTESNFKRVYRNALDRHKEEQKIPESVKVLLGNVSERMAITGD